MAILAQLPKKIILGFIKIYRFMLSPWFGHSCRFYPTCSQYALDAVGKHGVFYGSFLAVKRIGKCHPFHPGGIDHVS